MAAAAVDDRRSRLADRCRRHRRLRLRANSRVPTVNEHKKASDNNRKIEYRTRSTARLSSSSARQRTSPICSMSAAATAAARLPLAAPRSSSMSIVTSCLVFDRGEIECNVWRSVNNTVSHHTNQISVASTPTLLLLVTQQPTTKQSRQTIKLKVVCFEKLLEHVLPPNDDYFRPNKKQKNNKKSRQVLIRILLASL